MPPAAAQDRGDRVTHIAWLAPQLLAAIVQTGLPADPDRSLRLVTRQGRETLELIATWLDCTPEEASDRPHAWILAATLPEALDPRDLARLVLVDGAARRRVRPLKLADVTCRPMELAETCRDGFGTAARARVQAFLASIPQNFGLLPLEPALAEQLAAMRDVVREPLPTTKIEPGPCSARFESIGAVDEYAYWVSGWFHGQDPSEVAVTAVSPEGTRADVPARAISFQERPEVAKRLDDDERYATLGFRAYVELDQPSRHGTGWLLEFTSTNGETVEDRAAGPVNRGVEPIWKALLEQLRVMPQDEVLLANQVLPTMVRLRGGDHDPQIDRLVELGELPTAPETSIVVAVRAADRIEHQLAQFARDPELADAELVFVAAGGDPLLVLCEELSVLYGLQFRLVLLSKAARRGRALNLGVSETRGEYLVLMSGDVLPDAPGWLGTLRATLDSDDEIAAVAPKLLNEDDSIAHAGTEYVRGRGTVRWERAWPFAGLGRDVFDANVGRPMLAGSDACLMTTASRFADCGGMSELYLGGGDEGTDLCLRFAERGGQTWYVPAAELYNLDRPAIDRAPAPAGVRFNDWLLDWRWGARLAKAAAAAHEQPT